MIYTEWFHVTVFCSFFPEFTTLFQIFNKKIRQIEEAYYRKFHIGIFQFEVVFSGEDENNQILKLWFLKIPKAQK